MWVSQTIFYRVWLAGGGRRGDHIKMHGNAIALIDIGVASHCNRRVVVIDSHLDATLGTLANVIAGTAIGHQPIEEKAIIATTAIHIIIGIQQERNPHPSIASNQPDTAMKDTTARGIAANCRNPISVNPCCASHL